MATHSSILAWGILWTEEPGGLLSMGLQSQRQLKRPLMHACIVYWNQFGVMWKTVYKYFIK